MSELRCIGCGSVIQTTTKEKPGYVPQSALEKSEDRVVCQRCFRLRHYNEVLPVTISQDDFYRAISSIASTDALIVNIIDVFDIEGSLIPQISKLTNHNDLLIVANKRDLLPKSVNNGKLIHHIKKLVSDANLKPLDVVLMSATKKHHLDDVMDTIMKYAKGRDIYIVGATNVGKSTFINAVLQSYADAKGDVITVSQTAGTTLAMIRIPLEDQELIDTPGIINDVQLTHYVDTKTLSFITPKKEIKPRGYQLQPKQTLFLNGFARIDFVDGVNTSFIVYASSMIYIHRTKLENADNLYQTRRFDVLAPPYEGDEFPLKRYVFQTKNTQDIVLPGLGFITIKGPVTIHVHVHHKTTPYLRGALI
jgi:ribosome biogenesis GTPase YqeH